MTIATTELLSKPAPAPSPTPSLSREAWTRIGLLAAVMAVVFAYNLQRLWNKTNPINGEPNWGHSVIVPLVGLYYLYINRERLLATPIEPLLAGRFTKFRLITGGLLVAMAIAVSLIGQFVTTDNLVLGGLKTVAPSALGLLGVLVLAFDWGIGLLIYGLVVFLYGIWPGQNDMIKDIGMVITLFGATLTLCGWRIMRIAWFPIAFLICALPWPPLVYSQVATPLQNLAAQVSVWTLQITGVEAAKNGTKIFIGGGFSGKPGRVLNVAEACAGMRSLMTFISLGAAVAFLSNRAMWQKILITLSAIPIAVACNVGRVAGQGIIDTYWSHDFADGFAHQVAGIVMIIPAFFMLLAVIWLIDNLFIEEADATSTKILRARPTGDTPAVAPTSARRRSAT